MKYDLNVLIALIKKQQEPFETALAGAMQEKVNWIRKMNGLPLTSRQKESLERDKNLIVAAENYLNIQQKVIARLFEQLEQALNINSQLLADKLAADQTLINYIERIMNDEGKVQPAA